MTTPIKIQSDWAKEAARNEAKRQMATVIKVAKKKDTPTMTTKTLEAVAKAIDPEAFEVDEKQYVDPRHQNNSNMERGWRRDHAMKQARAALQALSENISDEMSDAAYEKAEVSREHEQDYLSNPEEVIQAAIQAALGEEE